MKNEKVEVHLFKPQGKWYTEIELVWKEEENGRELLPDIFVRLMQEQFPELWNSEFRAVCISQNHPHSHPLMKETAGLCARMEEDLCEKS